MTLLTRLLGNPYIILTLTASIWGSNAVMGRAAPDAISPAMLTLGRWCIALCICSTVFRAQISRDLPVIKARFWVPMGLGVIGYAMFNYLLYLSLVFLPATTSAIYQTSIPLLIFIINFAFLRHRPRALEVGGFCLTVIGVAVLVTKGVPLMLFDTQFGTGEIIILAAALCYASFTVGLRFKPQMHWQSFLTMAICGAALTAGALALIELSRGALLAPTGAKGWLFILYAGIFPSILAQAFFIRGVEMIGAARAALFINLVPVFAALMAILLINEPVQAYHLISMVLVIGGVSIAQAKSGG